MPNWQKWVFLKRGMLLKINFNPKKILKTLKILKIPMLAIVVQ
jgi:hypothetical protein